MKMTDRSTRARGKLWGILLAGGDGRRLEGFVRRVLEQDWPKQYCAFIGRRSMLQHTLDRARNLVPPERLLTVITAGHRDWALGQLEGQPGATLVIQPANRDTAPGLLLPVLRIHRDDPEAVVAVFPADHFILEEARFLAHVLWAAEAAHQDPSRMILLGVEPDGPAVGYGWIDPGESLLGEADWEIRAVARFREKPDQAIAARLYAQGWLWNTLILVTSVQALIAQATRHLPEVMRVLLPLVPQLGGRRERAGLEHAYARLPAINLSTGLLERCPQALGVVPVRGVLWSDWGEPERIVRTVVQLGHRPAWLTRWYGLAGSPDLAGGAGPR